ncbi:MAG TPA: hypothetical protein VHW46_17295 [Terracidiphilus sp.]|nr:hypothetical protein [Terracidiphilus sp.]
MVTLRAVEALFAGLAATVLLSFAVKFLLQQFAPDWAEEAGLLSAGLMVVNLGTSLLTAAAGGYVTAWTTQGNALASVLVLAVIVLVLSALSALQTRGKGPIPYQLALVALAPLGVLAGGLVRLRVEGILQ